MKLKEEVFLFQQTGKPILRLEWNPKAPGVFAAGGEDQNLSIYDCSKIDKNNGLIFIHPGC